VDAQIIDSSGNDVTEGNTNDQVVQVGIGKYIVATGDSITDGFGGSFNISADGRNSGNGYEPKLNNLLTAHYGAPVTVENEGAPGMTSSYGVADINTILAKHPEAQRILVQWGTNDADPIWYAVPSGLGLKPGDSGYPGSFKYNLQKIIDAINSHGKEVCLAKLPIPLVDSFGDPRYTNPANPPAGSRGDFIIQYNAVIDELVAASSNHITVVPPDFWSLFNENVAGGKRYDTEYYDGIHPNGTGYQSMANLWYQRLTQ
jgi:lysophospholipase L1-like esterase